jgi:hypothetical protein
MLSPAGGKPAPRIAADELAWVAKPRSFWFAVGKPQRDAASANSMHWIYELVRRRPKRRRHFVLPAQSMMRPQPECSPAASYRFSIVSMRFARTGGETPLKPAGFKSQISNFKSESVPGIARSIAAN